MVEPSKARNKAMKYGAEADMAETLCREMISGFIKMEWKEFYKK